MAGDWLDEAKVAGIFGLLTITVILLAPAACFVAAAGGDTLPWLAL